MSVFIHKQATFSLAAISAAVLLANTVIAQEQRIEEVTIIGDPSAAVTLPGSAYVLTEEELGKFEYTDINRMLRQVPGVYLQEEDGYGLRPNIGIRAAGAERSGKINLLEDGVPISPAPYSAPSAYYFPTSGRMSGVEVLKGPTILRHGPATVAGAVNMISTRIPQGSAGNVTVEAGQYGSNRIHANYGKSFENGGFLVETHQQDAQGYKDIDRSNRDSGFHIEDYVLKGRLNSDVGADGIYHQLDVKYQYSEESSNETYVGLTDADFNADENRRYGLTDLDQMNTSHSGTNLRYLMEFSDNLSLTTTAYYNKFERDWFKVDKIEHEDFGKVSYRNIIEAANNGNATAQAVLDGTEEAGIGIKHNNREYLSQGLQFVLDWQMAEHAIEAGLRYHEDEVDRFQPTEYFNQINGSLVFDSIGSVSSSNNRIGTAEAVSLYATDVWSVTDALDVTLGLRYEDYDMDQTRYEDEARTTVDSYRESSVDQLLWSAGVTYDLNDQWQLLAGYHTGFAPTSPSSKGNIDPEESENFEVGTRFDNGDLQMSAIGFYSDYSNRVTNCSVAFPCGDGSESGSESEGAAEALGLEFTLNTNLYSGSGYDLPLMVSYTYTDGEITDAQDSGNQDGDVLAYVPENMLTAQFGLELASGWNSYISASYIDEMCVDNTCGRADEDQRFNSTDDLLVVDFASHYPLTDSATVYFKLDNMFDTQNIVARSPGGARPNMPRTASVGMKVNF